VIVRFFVKFDGSDSNVATVLYNCDPDKVFIGMRVKVLWAKQTQGMMSDMEGVEPLEEADTRS
jgi:uncharacterized OB-fold protein